MSQHCPDVEFTELVLNVWDLETGLALGNDRPVCQQPAGAIFDSEAARLAVFCRTERQVLVVSPAGEPVVMSFVHWGGEQLRFALHGRHLAVGSASSLGVIDLDSGRWQATTDVAGGVEALALSGDNQLVTASKEGEVVLWSITSAGVEQEQVLEGGGNVTALTFGPRAEVILFGNALGAIGFWEYPYDKEAIQIKQLSTRVEGIAFSPDGRWLTLYESNRLHLSRVPIANVEAMMERANQELGVKTD